MFSAGFRNRCSVGVLAGCIAFGSAVTSPAQDKDQTAGSESQAAQGTQVDPLKRPIPEKQKKANAKALRVELSKTYRKWLDEDVHWIITDEERSAFMQLSNDEERDQFIEAFWQRRDPTPDTEENEFKEEHYRRIAYANEHFAAGIPGWKTDRGRMYIVFGPADEIDSHPSGGSYERPMEEGGGETSTYPFETLALSLHRGNRAGSHDRVRRHLHVRRLSHDDGPLRKRRAEIHAECRSDALRADGHGEQGQPFSNGGMEQLGAGPFNKICRPRNSIAWRQFAKLQAAPAVKFKDLEEVVSHKIIVNLMPFDVRADFVKVTSDTVLVPITIQIKNRDVTFQNKDGVERGTVNIFGRVTTLTGKVRPDLRRHRAG